MTWVAIPDTFADDPRLTKLGFKAFKALVAMWSFSNRHETDGLVPTEHFAALYGQDTLDGLMRERFVAIDCLGVHLDGFLSCNFSHETREAQRVAGREAGRLSGKARREKSILNRTNRSANGSTIRRTPVPVPVPDTNTETGTGMNPISASAPSAPMPESASREPKTRKPRPPKPVHPRRAEVMVALDGIHEKATGFKINWSDGKNRAHADFFAASPYPTSEIETRASRFWIDHLPGFVWNGKLTVCSLGDFRAHFDRLAVAIVPKESTFGDDFRPYTGDNYLDRSGGVQ